jgi:hypothetical protein
MLLYNKKDTFIVVFGVAFFHILDILLCIFCIQKFIIVAKNPNGYLLFGMLVLLVVIFDIALAKVHGFRRFLIRCNVDYDGINCSFLGIKKWTLLWKDICIYGICGLSATSKYALYGIVFLSTNVSEKYGKDTCSLITPRRIVFQIEQKRWDVISIYMPKQMKDRLDNAIVNNRDCYYRIK